MSNPFYGYDSSRGPPPQQPQQPPQPHQQPPAFGFPANAYNNYPYQQQQQYAAYNYGVGGNNQDPSQGAYAFNATQIPGLSAAGAATSPSTSPHNAPPGISSWGNHTGPPPAPPAYNLAGSYGTQQAQVTETVQHKSNTVDTPAIPSKSQVDDVEDGELSEGQFEDLYEDSKTIEQVAHRHAQSHAKQATRQLEPFADEGEEGEEGEITGEASFDNTGTCTLGLGQTIVINKCSSCSVRFVFAFIGNNSAGGCSCRTSTCPGQQSTRHSPQSNHVEVQGRACRKSAGRPIRGAVEERGPSSGSTSLAGWCSPSNIPRGGFQKRGDRRDLC